MLGSTERPFQARVRRVKFEVLYGSTADHNTPVDRPRNVNVIVILIFVYGAASVVGTSEAIGRALADPESPTAELIGFGLAAPLLLMAALLFLATVGLWRLRKWGLGLATTCSVLYLVWGIFKSVTLFADIPALLLSIEGMTFLLAMSLALAILLYVVRPGVSAQFR